MAILTLIFTCGDQPSSAKTSASCDVGTTPDDDTELEKSNILLIGPTGSGAVEAYLFSYLTIANAMLFVC